MDKVIRGLRRLLLFIGVLACLYMTVYNMDDVPLESYGDMYIVNEYVEPYYEMLSDNVGLTHVNGISNVLINMKNDGYELYNQDVTDSYIDISFIKEGYPSYRYYFTYPDGRVTFFCSDYESSYTGLSYIIERKE